METIKVNMNPNPLDVQTIHASQNDGEARQWGFKLHNNGDAIDSSEVTDQMVFKAYKGGTEQLLPENTSTPTTSPFKGDIKYPQGLLTDQEFTYRQSPTEEDGLAKIESIKGNTLIWNQLVSSSASSLTLTNGHKYYTVLGGIKAITNGTDQSISVTGGTDMVIDLTQMFGAGNEPATVDAFTALFPLSYYSYNQGSLLSFNGNGIKTVGKNQFDKESVVHGHFINGIDISAGNPDVAHSDYISVLANTVYCSNIPNLAGINKIAFYDIGKNLISFGNKTPTQWTTPSNCAFVRINMREDDVDTVYFNIGTDTAYEPYTSSTLSLPISTYFPNGMDGVGDAYDELSNSGYAKRMGRIDLGSITYTREESQVSGIYYFVGPYNSIPNIKTKSNALVWNIKTPLYETVTASNIYLGRAQNKTIGGYDDRTVRIRDDSFTDATSFKNSLSGQYLVYELATPTETSFTTASLVTENAEIPLSNEDGVLIGKCTEQLSENPGFIDAKIKLSDSDGECYSNKIQLHVERSPK